LVQLFCLTLCTSIAGGGLEKVAGGNLTSLNVQGCRNVTDAWLEKVAAGCPNLTSLNLQGCRNVTDAGLEKVAAGYLNLTSLNVQGCSDIRDAGLEKVAAGCPT
jgi:F-box/leucine-rich repeat protein 2/20